MSRIMGERIDSSGWSFIIPLSSSELSPYLRNEVVDAAVAALQGKRGAPFRRSRHATTWKVQTVGMSGEPANIFVKQLDVAHGLAARVRAAVRAKRSEHVLGISEDLRRDHLGVPEVLLIGNDPATGREVIVMNQAAGFMLTRWMNPSHRIDVILRRRILHQLGAEVARLHLSGYVHGDLTPYNIFATGEHQTVITFIDHEGTEKASRARINLARHRMRNLVQLGHFDLPGISRSDKMRVFASYAAAMSFTPRAKRQSLRGLRKMIERRRTRDRAINRFASKPAIIAEEDAARG
jgi:hypothetical protein